MRPLLPLSTLALPSSTSKTTSRGRNTKGCDSCQRTRHSEVQHRLVHSTCHLATLFVFAVVLLGVTGTCGWVGWLMYARHNAYAQSVFAPALVPVPRFVEPLVPAFVPDSNFSFVQAQADLDVRLQTLNLPPSTLPCDESLSNSTFATRRYTPLTTSGPYLVAINLYNSQHVIPTLARTLLEVAEFLGPRNVHVSIFENGSTDNTTLALAHVAAALTAVRVEHTIKSDTRVTDWKRVDRIDQLAIYRNVALSPVVAGLDDRPFRDVVFINDVFAGPIDVLELLLQRREQHADAACAIDWKETSGFLSRWGAQSVKMYDNWVTRSITGNMLRNRVDIWNQARHGIEELYDPGIDAPSRDRLRRGLPVPVYSCWNGMLALDAEPFTSTRVNPQARERIGPVSSSSAAELRSSHEPTMFRTALNVPGECAASECKTIARDFWARGYNRWIIVPTVRVTYSESVYSHPHLIGIATRLRNFLQAEAKLPTLPSHLSPTIDWSLPEWRAPESVVCWSWARGFHIDLPWWRSTKEKPWR
ncbi:glycosyltransferase family 69 protein [Sporobolomyces koalae]|uniref:glycosyltransferase family 69 protein n=1 Tax=Sporobolomyces koalae TaxID=500713 RepID=UPI00317F785B